MKFSKNSWRMLFLNITLMVVVGIIAILAFFMWYLPTSTKHGESITVPNLVGLPLQELNEIIEKRQLRYEVSEDSLFSSDYPPFTVLKQYPLPNAKVKENRRIYISLNAKNPPLVKMPKLVDGSVKSAQLVLKSYDLQLGNIRYVADIAANAVIQQYYQGQIIAEDTYLPKGAKIDLEVGDGLGNQEFESPFLYGLSLDDAQFSIIGSGLNVGNIYYSRGTLVEVETENQNGEITLTKKEFAPGSVYKQRPLPRKSVKLGQAIDLWVVESDSTSTNIDKIF
jgi:beta-lactam-binding protein with PASTA domain